MKLIIAEKPELGKALASVIEGKTEQKDQCIHKGDYVITWAYGHLLTVKEPEDYNPEYKKWRLEDLPFCFPNWETKISPGKEERVKQIGELLKQADVVYHAGDPDDEGQLIVDEILRYHNYKGRVVRLNTSDDTAAGLKRTIENPEDNSMYENDGWSAYARSICDAMFGFNLSRFFTLKSRQRQAVGRVQTPTLGMVVRRDMLIESHEKIKYYQPHPIVLVNGEKLTCKMKLKETNHSLDDGKILDRAVAEEIKENITGKNLDCKVAKKNRLVNQPRPFSTTRLQAYCGKKFGYSVHQVAEITQTLREKYHCITYNRTDCESLPVEIFNQSEEIIKTVESNLAFNVSGVSYETMPGCFNDEELTAHHAIIPQNQKVDVSSMTIEERNVYETIAKFFVIQFMAPAEKILTELTSSLENGDEIKLSSSAILHPGYMDFLSEKEDSPAEDDEDAQTSLSSLDAGNYNMKIEDVDIKECETKPPGRYTEGTLITDMTKISKYVKNEEIRNLLIEKDKDSKEDNGSIGTSATREGIITELQEKGYLKNEKGKLYSTQLGRDFFNLLPEELTMPDMTARWFALQKEIKKDGKYQRLVDDVLAEIKNIISAEYNFAFDTLGKCPYCSSNVTRWQKFYRCENGNCNFIVWKTIAQKNITDEIVADILENGKSKEIKDFVSKKGNTFAAKLKIVESPEEGEACVEMVFPPKTNNKSHRKKH